MGGDVTTLMILNSTTGSLPKLGIGTLTPDRKLVVSGDNTSGAEISLTNTDMTWCNRRTMNWFMSGEKTLEFLNDASNNEVQM